MTIDAVEVTLVKNVVVDAVAAVAADVDDDDDDDCCCYCYSSPNVYCCSMNGNKACWKVTGALDFCCCAGSVSRLIVFMKTSTFILLFFHIVHRKCSTLINNML